MLLLGPTKWLDTTVSISKMVVQISRELCVMNPTLVDSREKVVELTCITERSEFTMVTRKPPRGRHSGFRCNITTARVAEVTVLT